MPGLAFEDLVQRVVAPVAVDYPFQRVFVAADLPPFLEYSLGAAKLRGDVGAGHVSRDVLLAERAVGELAAVVGRNEGPADEHDVPAEVTEGTVAVRRAVRQALEG